MISTTLRRIYAGGLACALVVAAVGFALERARFGASEAEGLARVERSIQSDITAVAAALTEVASLVAREPGLFDAAAADPVGPGARLLFDGTDQALQGRAPGEFAVSAYRPSGSGTPLAWSGRPSEIPLERLSEGEAFFVESVPLGIRLVYVRPVTDSATGHRLGMIAAERVLSASRGIRAPSAEATLSIPTVVPVTVRPHDASLTSLPHTFVIAAPDGHPLLDARVAPDALQESRAQWRGNVVGIVLVILALALIVSVAPLLRWRAALTSDGDRLSALGLVLALILGARALLWLAPVRTWTPQIFHTEALGSALRALLRSPLDFLLTLLLLAALVLLGFDFAERIRHLIHQRRHRHAAPAGTRDWGWFAVSQLAAGALVALLLVGYEVVLGNAISATSVDALHFSLHPWSYTAASRITFAIAVILTQGVVLWAGALIVQLTSLPWRIPRTGSAAVAAFLFRAIPITIIAAYPRIIGAAPSTVPPGPTALAGFACLALAWGLAWGRPRYRHASQALRLVAGAMVLLIPAFVLYPSLLHFADRGLRRLIEEQYAEQAFQQRNRLQEKVRAVLEQIDREPPAPLTDIPAPRESFSQASLAFWSQTDLATDRLAASIELYGPEGTLVSRFAPNLPEYLSSAQRWREPSCQWEIFEEASPFGSEERRLLHAGRGICVGDSEKPTGGSIVVNVMLDYEALPFITVRNPYYEALRAPDDVPEGNTGRDVEFVVYGWGRGALYASGRSAWPLNEELLDRIASSRQRFWTTISNGNRRYSTYILNDRAGIYVIGYPSISAIDHVINLAELATLVGLTYVALLGFVWAVTAVGGQSAASGREVLREVRASFYRKLFLAFLAASLVPVLILAYATRAFFANQLRAGIQSDAVRVAAVAQRVVEEYEALRQREAGAAPDDEIMVWLSRAIAQDVNIYQGSQLLATSERDLFDSGLLPERTPSAVYRAIVLERLSSKVSEEMAGQTPYTLAAAPVRVGEDRGILTVPLALREIEIEREIDTLDRRVLLASLLFALLGAGIGYYMAERIGDPVSRLTRATRRIAHGDFSARVVQTSTDELRRLVDDFNRMAADLQRQRGELERTHRLEAWAEMARQVAHEIKNPLTPIQLSAEHLVRVNRDKGKPLTPVLEDCVTAIMSQVKLLRQISAEFSSFASSPTAHPAPTSLAELLPAVLDPYITGLDGRVVIRTDLPAALPMVVVDRNLLARAITNIVENALHAMPGGGSLTVTADATPATVKLSFADTGTGMDADALRRVFEPYFSTKATGTGLGLTIAKRNVELSGGSITVRSAAGKGTVVTIALPTAERTE